MEKKTKIRVMLSLGVMSTLATTGSLVLSCGNSKPPVISDQQKLEGITTEMVNYAITAKLNPDPASAVSDAPTDNKFIEISINNLDDVSITISNWNRDIVLGSVSLSIVSIDKGNAHVSGDKFGTITISGYHTPKFNHIAFPGTPEPTYIKCIIQTKTKEYFVGTTAGLWSSSDGINFNLVGGGLQNSFAIWSIYQTPDGIIYVGTHSNGLWRSANGTVFTKVGGESAITSMLFIRSLYQTSYGQLFVGTNAGLWLLNDSGTNLTKVDLGLGSHYISCIYQSNGLIFVGTYNHGLYVSINSGAFNHVSGNLGDNWNIESIYSTSDGSIFVGTISSVGLWVSKDGGINFTKVTGGLDILDKLDIYSIYQIQNGYILIGTSLKGLLISKDGGNSFTRFDGGLGNDSSIYSIFQSFDDSKLFIGTTKNGLWKSDDFK